MAFTKNRKGEMITQYEQWLKQSQAMYLVSYKKMGMKEIDALRTKVRETGSEIHVVKNTLFSRVLDEMNIPHEKFLEGTTLVGFAFQDPPALAKALSESTAKSEVFAIKGGFLQNQPLRPEQVKAMADLPALPVMRATLLGLIMNPATQLARTIREPARQIAAVVQAHNEKEAPVAEAA